MATVALGVGTADPCSKVALIGAVLGGDEMQSLAVHALATNFLSVAVAHANLLGGLLPYLVALLVETHHQEGS